MSIALLPPRIADPDVKVRTYRKEEQGTGTVCPTCKCMVPVRTYPGHVRFCYKCQKCNQYKTNKSQHDPICKGIQNAKDGVPCPYCDGRLVSDMLRHARQKHNFTKDEAYIFRKNKSERGTSKEEQRKAKHSSNMARKKLAKMAKAEELTLESKWASMILQANVRGGPKPKSPTSSSVEGVKTSSPLGTPPHSSVQPATDATTPPPTAVTENTASPLGKVGSVSDSDSQHDKSTDASSVLDESNPANTGFVEDAMMVTEEPPNPANPDLDSVPMDTDEPALPIEQDLDTVMMDIPEPEKVGI